MVHHDDLIASTEGRAFWIMDDITPLRDMAAAKSAIAASNAFLFKPRDTWRIEMGGGIPGLLQGNLGRNPPPGVIVRYALAQAADSAHEVQLDVLDASGAVMRSFSTRTPEPAGSARRGPPGSSPPALLPGKQGMNTVLWDMRTTPPTLVPNLFLPDPVRGGYFVAPGQYTARLTVNAQSGVKVMSQTFTLKGDPRVPTTDADRQKAVALARTVWQRISEIHQNALDTRSIRDQVIGAEGRARDAGEASLEQMGKELETRADSIARKMAQDRTRNNQDVINFRNGISAQYVYLQNQIDGSDAAPTKGMSDRLTEIDTMWGSLRSEVDRLMVDVEKYNALLKEKGIPGVVVPRRAKVATD
jgi:hypothetical protein